MKRTIAAVVALLAVLVVTITVTDEGSGPTHKHTVTITLGGPGHKEVALPPPAQQVAATQQAQDAAGQEQAAHADLRAEPPASKTPEVLAHDEQLTPPGQPEVPAHPPLATVSEPGCRTLLVRNFSSRQGSPILLGVLHFTVSADNGWNGVLGNVKWFDTPASQASSTYVVARTGECALTVPESQKAWTQAGFNRVSLSIEVTNTGRYPTYVLQGGQDRLVQLLVGWHKRWGLPLRHGAVSGCTVVRSGIVQHADLGQCGGGHVDVRPYPIDPLIAAAQRAVQGSSASKLAAARRSHRIVHAKLAKRCRTRPRPAGCTLLYKRNGELHAKYRNL